MRTHNRKSDALWRIRRFLGVVALALMLPATASAATVNLAVSFTGGQLGDVSVDVTITADFSVSQFNQTVGFTVNSMTSSVFPGQDPFPLSVGPLAFSYNRAFDVLTVGGGSPGTIAGVTTDIAITVFDFTTGPAEVFVDDTLASIPGFPSATVISSKLTRIPAVPLPAGLPLLLSGLFGLFGLLRIGKLRMGFKPPFPTQTIS